MLCIFLDMQITRTEQKSSAGSLFRFAQPVGGLLQGQLVALSAERVADERQQTIHADSRRTHSCFR